MATEPRHAAWQRQRIYAVRLLSGPEAAVDLADGLTDLLEAVEFALEWLDRVDPGRERALRLSIVEMREGGAEEVWTYPSERQDDEQDLVEVFGFDPVAWRSNVRAYTASEQRIRLGDRMRPAVAPPAPPPREEERRHEPAVAVAAPPAVEPPPPVDRARLRRAPAAAPADVPVTESVAPPAAAAVRPHRREGRLEEVRGLIELLTRGAWEDPFSRACVLVSAATLWLALGFADPLFLIPLLVSLPALYRRQRSRAEAADDEPDWF